MSISSAQAAGSPVKNSLATLRSGHDSFSQFVIDLFDDLEAMRQKLADVESQLDEERHELARNRQQMVDEFRQLSDTMVQRDPALEAKLSELEQDRSALEEELEGVRSRAVSMAQTIAEQKRQMAEEHAEWAAELRQLRRILDKQATWIAQQAEVGTASLPPGGYPLQPPTAPSGYVSAPATATGQVKQNGSVPTTSAGGYGDPVLGSVLSQFELLQKDVARRREQNAGERGSKNRSVG